MKKLLTIFTCIALIFITSACGSNKKEDEKKIEEPPKVEVNETDKDNIEESNTEKEEKVTEEIKYSKKEVNDSNKEIGYKKITQKGVNGTKDIYYIVTYDSNGKELSRVKTKEEVTKKPIDEITTIGTKKKATTTSNKNKQSNKTSNKNSNTTTNSNEPTNFLKEELIGRYCTEDKLIGSGNNRQCDESKLDNMSFFYGVTINNVTYAHTMLTKNIPDDFKLTKLTNTLYKATLNGTVYYYSYTGGKPNMNQYIYAWQCEQYRVTTCK